MLEIGGYEVLPAVDGLDGLHAFSMSLPDLIISDLNMARMSGFEFLAVVRERFPHIATVAVSGEYIAIRNPSGVLADAFSGQLYLLRNGNRQRPEWNNGQAILADCLRHQRRALSLCSCGDFASGRQRRRLFK
jgi:CheY-like chemotaxis protein